MVDIVTEDIDVVTSSDIVVETVEEVVIDCIERDIEVTFDSNEFSIVGDDMVVLTRYEDAPQWMKDVINNLVDVKASLVVGDLSATREALDAMLAQLDVAKNTYELSIVSSNDINQRITTAIETLNSSLQDADATILNVAQTAVTPSEASAIALNTLSASLTANGTIGSALHNLQSAMTTLEGTTASDISYLNSVMEGEIEGNATAMQTLRTYVGVTEAGASANTGLSAYLVGSNGVAGSADSKVANNVYVDGNGVPRSKFEYNSSLNIGGTTYNSGFGLSNSAGTGVGSEFWINADKFKFTNNGKTGSKAPFSIDASGPTPQIYFNGVVSFSNVADTSGLINSISTAQSTANTANSNALARTLPSEVANAINTNTTTINGSKITTGSITAGQIQAGSVSADRLTSTNGSSTVWAGGGLISANFNGNVVGNIGSPNSGFRLSSNAAGTLGSNDPNIYGAYILGSIIDASSSFITSSYLNSSKTGSAIATKVNPILYGANYSSGFLSTRFTKTSSYAIVSAHGRQYIHEDHPSTTYLEYTVDGGTTWVVLDSVYNSSSGGNLDIRVTLTGIVISSSVPTAGYMQFRTRYTVNGDTSFTNVTIIATVYNI